ncbi:MAG: hypothetical protein ABJB22_01595 [Verrucomicrobiota bacterium]
MIRTTTLCTAALIGIVFLPWAGAGPLPPLPRSVSASRQFIVYGTDVPVRGALCNAGERTKATLLALLQQPDQWKTPIVINAQYPQSNLPDVPRVALYFNQTGFGLKLQLDLVIGPDVSGPAVERELLRAVLLELMYRARPNLPPGTTFVQPPDWLLDGVLASTGNRDPSAFVEILQGLVAANKVMPLEQFLSQRPDLLDSPSRQLFSAYSFALISLLTDGPENRPRFARYITDLPDSPNNVADDLRAHFPVLGVSPKAAEEAWVSNVARISAFNRYQSLSIAETERQLDTLLHLRFPELESCRLDDYTRFLRLPSRVPVLNQLGADLMLLGTRANPIYRPIILGYEEIVSALARKKTRRVARRLDQLANTRKETGARMEKIDDYLNWFEATQSQTRSGTFAEYLKAAGKSEDPEPRRRDAISVYLDVLEAQFQ